jgi:hypothetical protein
MVTEALPGAASGPSIRKENVANGPLEARDKSCPLMMFLVIGPSVFYGSSGTAAAATAQRAVSPAAASAHVAKPSYYVTPAGWNRSPRRPVGISRFQLVLQPRYRVRRRVAGLVGPRM